MKYDRMLNANQIEPNNSVASGMRMFLRRIRWRFSYMVMKGRKKSKPRMQGRRGLGNNMSLQS